jgi:hypothetical protein
MGLEQMIYSSFKHECVIDSNIADTILFVPAWLSSTGNGLVHYIVRDEEERLELVDVR